MVGDIAVDDNNVKWITAGNGITRLDGDTRTVFSADRPKVPLGATRLSRSRSRLAGAPGPAGRLTGRPAS